MIHRLMVFMPPGSAKSTYSTVLFPPFFLGFHEGNKNIITGTYGQVLSKRFGKRARAILLDIEYRRVYGFGLCSGSMAKDEWEVDPGGEYTATSVDGAATGRRADLLLIDDPVKGRKEADSEISRNTAGEWYKSDIRTRLKPGGAIVIIQTRWHEDDLSGRILPEDYDGQSGKITARDGEIWEVINIKAEADEHDPLGRNVGDFLWPEWFRPGFFEQEKITQGARNWNALYQQNPAPDEGTYFKREDLRYYVNAPAHMRIYGASDYAVTDDGGDFTEHGVIGVDPNDDIYVLDWWFGKTTTDVWIDELFRLALEWKPSEWGEESGQIIKSVGPFIQKRQRDEKNYFYRKQWTSASDKPTRAQAIRGRVQQNKVYFPIKPNDWTGHVIGQMMAFHAGKNDDSVDVLSLFGRMLARMQSGREPAEEKPVEYEKDLRRMTLDQIMSILKRKRVGDD